MRKKGESELIAIVLLIMVVIMIISAFAFFYFRYTDEIAERAMVGQILNNADITIRDVTLKDSQNLTITFFSGPGFQILMNYSVKEVNYTYVNVTQIVNTTLTYEVISSSVNVSVVSVADLSGSMGGSKITELKDATRQFVNSVLNYTGNEVGLVAYSSAACTRAYYCHALSDDNDSLISTVNSWRAGGYTCICCGIQRAMEYLQNAEESSHKVMIVMSDGLANVDCGVVSPELSGNPTQNPESTCTTEPNDACDDAIYLAGIAFNDYNITVHTIGFGGDVDAVTLRNIADAGNGSYYFADIGELEYIYEELSQDLAIPIENEQISYNQTNVTVYQNVTTVVYAPKENYYLKIIFYTEHSNYIQNKNLSDFPGPIETKEIEISLDPSWDITTDDLTKIEIYSAIIKEGKERYSDEPIAVWEKAGLYNIR